ncbi:MAG: nitroreductase family protein [bacterium]|nr:MAG: nitroreductase family protein [bacterium]
MHLDRDHVFLTILNRRSIRSFSPVEIPKEHINQFLEVLRWAPSAGNRQPWHFYVILNKEIQRKLARAAFQQDFISQAGIVFVVCGISEQSARRYGERGKTMYVFQDTAAAIQNLLLLATDLGYGSCWVGAFNETQVTEILSLPEGQRPLALIPVGKAAEKPVPPPRREIEQTVTILE